MPPTKDGLERHLESLRRMMNARRRQIQMMEQDVRTDLEMILKTRRRILEVERQEDTSDA